MPPRQITNDKTWKIQAAFFKTLLIPDIASFFESIFFRYDLCFSARIGKSGQLSCSELEGAFEFCWVSLGK